MRYTGCVKNDPNCFCQNFVKSVPNLIIFGSQIAKTMEMCKTYSMFTSRNLCQRRCSKLLHYAVIINIRFLTCALSITQKAPWNLIILWY